MVHWGKLLLAASGIGHIEPASAGRPVEADHSLSVDSARSFATKVWSVGNAPLAKKEQYPVLLLPKTCAKDGPWCGEAAVTHDLQNLRRRCFRGMPPG
mmetsp:Transcript_70075/g.130993  ORF Transcript_70075/g.130993 Transcript_70075/m.130993 type:complete len:98 (+) Transcript_70075:51-344(+)